MPEKRPSPNRVGFRTEVRTRGELFQRILIDPVARLFTKSAAQRAATAALLAASPQVAGLSGENWSNCQITHANPRLTDEILAKRLWETSEQIVFAIRAANRIALQAGVRDSAVVDRHSLVGVAD